MTITPSNPETEVQRLLDSPLTPTESKELEACELQIELAGKDRLEKALIIGEKLSTIYNNALFRGDGGRTWADWIENRLPELLPGEAIKETQANARRWLYEVRSCLSADLRGGVTSLATAEALKSLIPRRYDRNKSWNPAELDQPAEGLKAVWELAQRNAVKQQRKNGPTKQDVAAAREELRPTLLEQGLIREAPKAFQQSTAERMAAAQLKREQTVDVRTAEQIAKEEADFAEIMDDVKQRAPQVAAENRAKAVDEQLNCGAREHLAELEDNVRKYNSKLNSAVASVNELLGFLKSIDRIHGTQYLSEMRSITVAGLLTVEDDIERIKSTGASMMQIAELSTSSNPPSGIDMTTLDVDQL